MIERLRARAVRSGDCLLWTGATAKAAAGRYGKVTLTRAGRRRFVGAHRLMWEAHHGPLAAGVCVLHSCDTPLCIEPDHLFVGTHGDNARDREAKGRGGDSRGALNGGARLTEDQARAVLALGRAGWLHADVAAAFGICRTGVTRIISGARWAHLQGAGS